MAPNECIPKITEEKEMKKAIEEGEEGLVEVIPYRRTHESTKDGGTYNVIIHVSLYSYIKSVGEEKNGLMTEKRNALFFMEKDQRKMSALKFSNEESKLPSCSSSDNSLVKNSKSDDISPNQYLEKKRDDTQREGSV